MNHILPHLKYFANLFNQQPKAFRLINYVALILIVYGYLCRLFGIYFFWESKSIGWVLLFVGAIGFFATLHKIKRVEKKETFLEKIYIGLLIFMLVIKAVFFAATFLADGYAEAKTFVLTDKTIQAEVGHITGSSFALLGAYQQSTRQGTLQSGSAAICITVKGDKKFKDYMLYLSKDEENPHWQVDEIETCFP